MSSNDPRDGVVTTDPVELEPHDAWKAVVVDAPRAELRARALAAALAALPAVRPSSAADAMRAREENERRENEQRANESGQNDEPRADHQPSDTADNKARRDGAPSFPPAPAAASPAATGHVEQASTSSRKEDASTTGAKSDRVSVSSTSARADVGQTKPDGSWRTDSSSREHAQKAPHVSLDASTTNDPSGSRRETSAKAVDKTEGESARTELAKAPAAGRVQLVPVDGRRRIRTIGLATATALALAAGLVVYVGRDHGNAGAMHGDVTATGRTEVAVGARARAVLEPSAHVVWSSTDEVTQSEGSVFYRVEPGTTFRVHTPVGDVTVLGTCFRIKVHNDDVVNVIATPAGAHSGARGGGATGDASMNKRDLKAGVVGAVSTAIAFVAVYEGKVAVSHAGQSVQLVAGEAADLSSGAPRKDEDGSAAERAFDDRLRDEDEAKGDPSLRANRNLVASVGDYRARLERMDVQKRALESELAEARERLIAADAGLPSSSSNAPKNEIAEDEWKELAKNGTIKMRVPCNWKGGWWPPPNKLNELGLSRDDGPTIQAASNRLYETSWAKIRPICEKVGGKDLADKLGLDGCPSFVFNYMKGVDKENAYEAMRRVSEMRAGQRAMIAFDDPQLGPVEKVFLVMTGEQQAFETDLAQSFGPEEAHRIVTSDSLCSWSSTWNGPGPRKPPANP